MSTLQFLVHFGLGFITSFIGSIPLGSINAAVLRISINQTIRAAFLFIAGATIAELAYCFVAVHFSGFLLSIPKLEFYIQLISIPIFLLLALSYWVAKSKTDQPNKVESKKPFFQGLTLGFLNPLQIPFWLAYGTYFLSTGWIQQNTFLLTIFILGAVAGSAFLLFLIAKFASVYSSKIRVSDKTVNRITAGILVALALYQLGKLLAKG